MIRHGREADRLFHLRRKLQGHYIHQILERRVSLFLPYRLAIIKTGRPIHEEPMRNVRQTIIRLQPLLVPRQNLTVSGKQGLHVCLIPTVHPIIVPHTNPPERERGYKLMYARRISAHRNPFRHHGLPSLLYGILHHIRV